MLSRRTLLRGAALSLGAPWLNRGRYALFAQNEAVYSALTLELVRRSTVIDMLGLLTLNFNKLSAWQAQPSSFHDADFQKLKESGINIFHPAVGYTDGNVYSSSLRDINGWNSLINAHPEDFFRVDGVADLDRAKRLGKIGILIGQQNSEHFRTVADVDFFYKLGQRVSQLTYTHNRVGGGSTDARDSGLSAYGAQIVERMNSVGMAIDISHCGDRTTLDAIEASKKPVLVTHSNCRALVASTRCKTDEAIQRLAAKGGVLGVTMVRGFVQAFGPATMDNVLDHIDHIAQLAGVEHVGVGTDVDLDGRDVRIRPKRKYDLDGVDYERKIFDLTEGLIRRRYSTSDIQLILGGNFERALTAIWGA